MLDHALAPVGRDDGELHAVGIADAVHLGVGHRARVECRDLVVVDVGGDEGLRGELPVEDAHVPRGEPEVLQALRVGREVVADRGHDLRLLAQELQVVGDVARGAAELAPQVGDHEGDVEDVDLVGEDVLLELVGEHHDGVVGQRPAYENRHAAKYKRALLADGRP